MASLRLASFKVGGRESYGAVTEQGIVDLGRKLTKYATLRDVLRAQAVGEARAAATGAADYRAQGRDHAAADPGAGEDHLRRHQLPRAHRRIQRRARSRRNIRTCSCRFPDSLVGTEQPIVRPKVSEKFDYEGEIVLVIGSEGRHIPRDKALSHGRRPDARQRRHRARLAAPRHAQRHPGQEFRQSGSLGPWIVPADDVDPGKPLHLMTRVNGELRQDDTTERLTWDFAWLIDYISTFATLETGRSDLHRHADRRRRSPDAAEMAQARRRGRGRSAGDRRPAEYRDGRGVTST